MTNPAIEVKESDQRDYFEIRGRGEMQLGILIEEMRREGYEMTLSPPTVMKRLGEDGVWLEPWEDVVIECGIAEGSAVIDRLAQRGAKIVDMASEGDRQTIKLEVSAVAALGLRTWVREISGGTATVMSEFKDMRPAGPAQPRERNGVLISNNSGISQACDLGKVSRLGTLFLGENVEVYPGMIFGEVSSSKDDIETNISRRHDGYRSAGPYSVTEKKLEQALTYINEDEQLEVTPKRVVMRKAILDATERKVAMKRAAKI